MVSTIYPSPSVEPLRRSLAVIVFMALFFFECKVYDLASAAFFAFGLGLMARQEWDGYFLVFVLGCMNRETMALLPLVYAVHFWGKMSWRLWTVVLLYQGLLFGVVRVCLMILFSSSPGAAFWFRLSENVNIFLDRPWWGLVHWLLLGLVMWLCVRRWREQPRLMRSAFVVMMPVLMALYLVFGWIGEVRVFAEMYPVMWLMMAGWRMNDRLLCE